ncbi:MAG: LPXTG cell wall anchor domain-containing protein [Anaerolineae bacterium]|nr:LPXTG cell wall anchor domain-containing protein [Anaerolineae bacterium]
MEFQCIWKISLSTLLGLAILLLLLTGLANVPVQAQSGTIYVYKQLGRSNNTVYVGEYLTFTIVIRNDAAFTITQLPLTDDYNEAVLHFVDASPVMPNTVDVGAGQLDWNDITDYFGDFPPGRQETLIVGFIAEHPEPSVVNAAAVHDAVGSGGNVGGEDSTFTDTTAIGGSSPLDKELLANLQPQIGQPMTFTIIITNAGYAPLSVLPLTDYYSPGWMTFSHAIPAPDTVDPINGILHWNDLTTVLGDVPAWGTVKITTVFTALTTGENIYNSAGVAGASDWYGNDVSGGADQVPIIIIDQPTQPTATPTRPRATSTPDDSDFEPTPTPFVPTPTPAFTPTPIFLLPQTGETSNYTGIFVLLLVLIIGITLFSRELKNKYRTHLSHNSHKGDI